MHLPNWEGATGPRWAANARTHPKVPLDPSLTNQKTGAKAGFDLTWPFGSGGRLETRVPAPDIHDGRPAAIVGSAHSQEVILGETLFDGL